MPQTARGLTPLRLCALALLLVAALVAAACEPDPPTTAPVPAPPGRFATRDAGAPPVPLPWSAGAAGLLGLAFDQAFPLRTVLGRGTGG